MELFLLPHPLRLAGPTSRIMPKVPENMQENLARLELDANASSRQTLPQSSYNNTPSQPQQQPQQPQPPIDQYGQQNQNIGYSRTPPQTHRSQHSLSAPGGPGSHSREGSVSSAMASPRT